MAGDASPDSNTEEEGTTEEEENENHERDRPNKLSMRAGKLAVEAESVDESVSDLAEVCSSEMENLMRYHIRGEMEMLEEQDLHSIILGGDD